MDMLVWALFVGGAVVAFSGGRIFDCGWRVALVMELLAFVLWHVAS